MPQAVDQEALDDPTRKILDINNPPLKHIAHQEYPRMVYLHPVDKTREHRTKIVHSADEFEAVKKQGWRSNPHIPIAPPDAEIEAGEFEIEESKRGPGRPRNDAA